MNLRDPSRQASSNSPASGSGVQGCGRGEAPTPSEGKVQPTGGHESSGTRSILRACPFRLTISTRRCSRSSMPCVGSSRRLRKRPTRSSSSLSRAAIMLLMAQNMSSVDIAERIGYTAVQLSILRPCFAHHCVVGLRDRARSGRRQPQKVVRQRALVITLKPARRRTRDLAFQAGAQYRASPLTRACPQAASGLSRLITAVETALSLAQLRPLVTRSAVHSAVSPPRVILAARCRGAARRRPDCRRPLRLSGASSPPCGCSSRRSFP